MSTASRPAHVRHWRFYAASRFGQVHGHAADPTDFGTTAAKEPAVTRRRPLVCFHGTPLSGVELALLQRELAQDRLVLCLDTPGFGGSDRPCNMPELPQYAAALFDALDNCGLIEVGATVDLLGHHTGAALACVLAAAHGGRVGKLVLSGVPLFSATEREQMMARFMKPSPIFSDPDFIPAEFRTNVLRESGGPPQRRLDLFVERLRAGTEAWWAGRAVFGHDLESTLRLIQQPSLLLMLRDPLVGNSRAARRLLVAAEVAELESGTGDAPLETDAAVVASAARQFLDR